MASVKKPITKAVTEEKPVVAAATPVVAKEAEVKPVEVKKAEPKKEVKKAEPKAAAKPAAKKAPAKKAEAKKTEVKKAEPKTAAKPAAKKAEPKAAAKPAAKKAPAKKVEAKTFVQVELDHVNYTEETIIKLAKKAYKDSKKKEALKDLKVYFNTNERKLYVVPNNNIEEQIVVDLRLQ